MQDEPFGLHSFVAFPSSLDYFKLAFCYYCLGKIVSEVYSFANLKEIHELA